jgi:hypothetical protein
MYCGHVGLRPNQAAKNQMTVVTTIAPIENDDEAEEDGCMSSLPFFPPIFWQGKFDNQAISVIVSVGAFHALLGKLLPGVGHMLQLLTMTERGRSRHDATFGGIATVFFDFFQSRRAYLLSAGHLRSPFLKQAGARWVSQPPTPGRAAAGDGISVRALRMRSPAL